VLSGGYCGFLLSGLGFSMFSLSITRHDIGVTYFVFGLPVRILGFPYFGSVCLRCILLQYPLIHISIIIFLNPIFGHLTLRFNDLDIDIYSVTGSFLLRSALSYLVCGILRNTVNAS
jgi:hypothetical protein